MILAEDSQGASSGLEGPFQVARCRHEGRESPLQTLRPPPTMSASRRSTYRAAGRAADRPRHAIPVFQQGCVPRAGIDASAPGDLTLQTALGKLLRRGLRLPYTTTAARLGAHV